MDDFAFIFAISCAIIALIYACKFLNWIWIRPKKLEKFLRQQGFNGNSYKLFHGDSTEMKAATKEAMSKPINFSDDILPRVTPIYHKALHKYGEKCFVWVGPRPTLVILDPEIIREMLLKNYDFHKPPGSPFDRQIANGLSSLEADKWAKHRKLLNPAFHLDKLKHMVPSFYLSCGEMLSKWDEIVGNEGCCEVDVWPHLLTMTSDVISRTAFGSSFEEGRKISQLQKKQAQRVMEENSSVNIPGYRFLPTKANRKTRQTTKEIESLVMGIINKRMKATEGSADDLLGLLLESNLKEMRHLGNESGMSIKEVIEECKIFYFAGHETVASLLVWTMILLSKHDDWQARARDEVLQLFGRGKPDYQKLNHLKIVSMIFQEVLRLYPPAAVLDRFVEKEMTVGKKVRLPAGVKIALPVILSHQDCKIWGDDAREFKPERFGDGVSKAGAGWGPQPAYIPFGWGPRICIGQNFAMLEAKIAMAMILQRYSFQLSPSYSHAPRSVITLQPQHGAHLILTKL
ncbi:cytochrome P450 CYP72A219-like [Salvia miltiorrhiza]|uniref:cytochrome P450 CYP72A219-like n=1 Tax=Salvia miltiorrhiza TaxID=226208 RepID=UPI0025ABFD43|nr:cytochrome P450 CYP72A219-like [Salvia miltiorrhiza]